MVTPLPGSTSASELFLFLSDGIFHSFRCSKMESLTEAVLEARSDNFPDRSRQVSHQTFTIVRSVYRKCSTRRSKMHQKVVDAGL